LVSVDVHSTPPKQFTLKWCAVLTLLEVGIAKTSKLDEVGALDKNAIGTNCWVSSSAKKDIMSGQTPTSNSHSINEEKIFRLNFPHKIVSTTTCSYVFARTWKKTYEYAEKPSEIDLISRNVFCTGW